MLSLSSESMVMPRIRQLKETLDSHWRLEQVSGSILLYSGFIIFGDWRLANVKHNT